MIEPENSRLAILAAAFLLLLPVCGCSEEVAETGYGEGSESGDVEWTLNTAELEIYEARAVSGDNRAAHIVANHYWSLDQKPKQTQWLQYAAKRGDCPAIYQLRARKDAKRKFWQEVGRANNCPTF